MTMAAGLAMAGLHPVVSIYATFLNRAFDQLLMDVALHKLPVTVTLDRAGVTGPDGASHNGMWDGSILQVVPGLRVAAPRDGSRIAELLGEAVAVSRRSHRGALAQGHRRGRGRGGRPARLDGHARRPRTRARPRRAAAGGRPDGRHLRRGRPAPRATTASGSPSSTRAGSSRSTRRSSPRPAAPAGRGGRGQRPGQAVSATRWRGCCATTTSTSRSRPTAWPRSSSTTAPAMRSSRRPG